MWGLIGLPSLWSQSPARPPPKSLGGIECRGSEQSGLLDSFVPGSITF